MEAIWVDKSIDVIRGGFRLDVYLLFKDRSAYKNCETPPADLNVNASRKLEKASAWKKYTKWTTWRKNSSGNYEVKNPKDGQRKVLDGIKATPGKPGERLNNTFWSFKGSQAYGSHKSSVMLMPNGRFELSSRSIMGGDMGGTGPYTGTASKSDKQGTSSSTVVSGDNVGGGGSIKKNDGAKNTGTYKIDGFTIEFQHDNGWVHRELFLFEKNKNSIVIKDEIYWVKKD